MKNWSFVFWFMVIFSLIVTSNIALVKAMDETVFGELPKEHTGEFISDWYETDAKPIIIASIENNKNFEEGESRVLRISLKNAGYVTAMEVTDNFPVTDQDKIAAKQELTLEDEGTTARAITAYIEKVNSNDPFEIKSATSHGGLLEYGQITNPPLEFEIEVEKDAKPGVYPLKLTVFYDYMRDVAVKAKSSSDSNTTYNYFYDMNNTVFKTLLYITIEDHPEFEIVESVSSMHAGTTNIITANFKNTGTEVARRSVAYISAVDPFESIIDEYYLGEMQPGESKVARFKVSMDAEAIPAIYGITTLVKYEDLDGKTKYSDTLKTTVDVKPAITITEKLQKYQFFIYLTVIGAVIFALLLISRLLYNKVLKKKRRDAK